MALCTVAPVASTVLFGRSIMGPISWDPGSTNWTPVLPAVCHLPVPGEYLSEFVLLAFASMVNTMPLGSRIHPSSELPSALPVPVVVQVRVVALNRASLLLRASACMYVLLVSTTLWPSPILLHPVGVFTAVRVLAMG